MHISFSTNISYSPHATCAVLWGNWNSVNDSINKRICNRNIRKNANANGLTFSTGNRKAEAIGDHFQWHEEFHRKLAAKIITSTHHKTHRIISSECAQLQIYLLSFWNISDCEYAMKLQYAISIAAHLRGFHIANFYEKKCPYLAGSDFIVHLAYYCLLILSSCLFQQSTEQTSIQRKLFN